MITKAIANSNNKMLLSSEESERNLPAHPSTFSNGDLNDDQLTPEEDKYLNKLAVFMVDMAYDEIMRERIKE
jgi:hypothetical protein